MERGNGDKIVKGDDGGGFERATHFLDDLVLGYLEGFDKTLNPRIVGV